MSSKRIEKIREKLDDIILKAQKRNVRFSVPELDERIKIRSIITDFIRDKKRLIYGGTAIEYWLKKKNISVYDEDLPGDVEFYSPTPLEDMYKICNKLKKAGYKNVVGRQALHHDTFTIFVEYIDFCDMTYMNPYMMKHNIPHYTDKGLSYVNPEFLLNDMYRVFANPLHDYPFRLKKVFERFVSLKENYFSPPEKPKVCPKESKEIPELTELKDVIFKSFVMNNEDIILSGYDAYNYFLEFSGYQQKNKNVHLAPKNSPMVILTSDIKDTTEKIIDLISEKDKLKIEEFTKFFQFYDRKLVILYNDNPLVEVMGHNGLCTQYHNMQPEDSEGFFQMVSYDYLMIYLNSSIFKNLEITETRKKFQCMIHYLDLMREYYLDKNKLIGIEEDNIFSHFVLECKWRSFSEIYKSRERIKKRVILKKKPVVYEYRPDVKIETIPPKIIYTNCSGNRIINIKNMIVKDKNYIPEEIKKKTKNRTIKHETKKSK